LDERPDESNQRAEPASALAPMPRAPAPAAHARVRALIALLEDDSPAVVSAVSAQLAEHGPLARARLKRLARGSQARLRARARNALSELEERVHLRRILARGLDPRFELERGLFLLAGLSRPRFDSRPYQRALDAMGQEVRRRAQRAPTGPSSVRAALELARYLGGELGYRGGEAGTSTPDDVHVHRVLERRRGLPLTLCALYAFVARRAGLRCTLVALPGRVLARLYGDGQSVLIDPFEGGRQRVRREIEANLARQGLVPQASWFQDADDALLLQRQLRNLAQSLRGAARGRSAARIEGVANELAQARELRLGQRRAAAGPRALG
jgi:regulator of sirC expression with transglutaminase-like and TPR domain